MSDVRTGALGQLRPALPDGYIFDDPRFNRLNGWTYLIMLLGESRRALDLSETYKSTDLIDTADLDRILLGQSLFRTAIMSYGKCFGSTGSGRIKLDGRQVFASDSGLMKTHDRMIEIRNKFAAHNDENDLDTAIIAVKEDADHFTVMHTYSLLTPFGDYDVFRAAIEHCSAEVVLRVNKYLDRLEKDLGKAIRLPE